MRIGIVGAFRGNKLQAPYGDPDWQIWTLSPKNESELPRHDAWFELHHRFMDDPYSDGPVYGEWLKSQPVLYMQARSPLYPGSIAYPIKEITDEFGWFFFVSSLAFMLALAITRKPQSIGIWGVDATVPEYAHQKAGIQHFVQTARHRGIEVIAPPDSRLLEPAPLYAFDSLE